MYLDLIQCEFFLNNNSKLLQNVRCVFEIHSTLEWYRMIIPICALLLHIKTGREDDNLERGVLSTESCMEPIDRPEVLPVPTVVVVQILVRYHLSFSTFSFHVCNYGTLIGS
jgi:hypothetical protein